MQDEKIPQQVEGIDIKHLKIAPQDGFVYSRVDGVLNVQDLADLVGVTSDEIQAAIERLIAQGVVRWLTADAAAATKKYAVAELNEEIDLDNEARQRILEKHAELPDATHYELLGVAPSASHAEIRTAYFKLSKEFHPDSHYGKNIGTFQAKMEVIFKRLTDAYDVLSKEAKRKKYDAYLEKRNAAKQVERQLARGAARAAAMERAMTQPPGAPAPQTAKMTAPPAASSTQPPPENYRPPTPTKVPAAPASTKEPVSLPPVEKKVRKGSQRAPAMPRMSEAPGVTTPPAVTKPPAQPAVTKPPDAPFRPPSVTMPAPPLERRNKPVREKVERPPRRKQESDSERVRRKRELLARKLRGRSFRPPAPKKPSTPPKPVEAQPKIGTRAALRGLTASLKQTAAFTGGVDRVQRHMESARLAELEGDLASAATALRMAMAIDPTHPDLQSEYHRVSHSLQTQLHDIHVEQARYEEENDLWAAAAISWAKVADGDPSDPIAPRRAGLALLKAGGDLRKARDFAQKSVELDPDSAYGRAVLAQIYLAADMQNSARKELEEAAKLDPDHEMVKNLLKKV